MSMPNAASFLLTVAMTALEETCSTVEDPQNGTKAGTFRMGDEGIICSPANAKTPLNCHLEAPADATRICFC